ncbi:S8 family serine peptidase [Sphingobacterium sp. DN00404]|uniref:S8 family serine peptidase n=1 Tax=Sphingobacterium micropteri TaxID=2763501 RepID=A0ABR7YTT4_9SPHI|nr:S8 family serine peptidase [Sphingobacterium micropteri]MBD1434685.1 S8 family serine peptidase [Sphingobacterium micropteri]
MNPIRNRILLQLKDLSEDGDNSISTLGLDALAEYLEEKKIDITSKLPPFLEIDLNISDNKNQILRDLTSYERTEQVLNVSQMFSDETTTNYGLINQLVVKFKHEATEEDLKRLKEQFHIVDIITVLGQVNTYILTLDKVSELDALDLSNILFETGRYIYAQPNFFTAIQTTAFTPNDPYYNSSWHLPKIEAPEAWCWASGDTINIGIVDIAVQIDHIDLSTLPGYDPTGMPIGTDRHGTVCAGAAAAIGNNGILVTGAAYKSKIIPIRIGYNPSSDPNNTTFYSIDSWKYGAMAYAVYNAPVHVLSCSFGLGNPSALVQSGFQLAYSNGGRSGKGIPIFAATGNDYASSINFPASSPYTMAVGATGDNDNRSVFSNYGAGIGIVAPGDGIFTTAYSDTFTISSGTSLATPIVAGVAAMILQCQPNYSPYHVYQILGTTTDKVGGVIYGNYGTTYPFGTWNNEMGYGRLNAYKAIQKALPFEISGSEIVCSNGTFEMQNLPSGSQITWDVTQQLNIVGANTSNPVNVQFASVGWATVTATINNSCGSPFERKLSVPVGPAPVPWDMNVNGPYNLAIFSKGLFTFPTTYPGDYYTEYIFLVNGQETGIDFQIDFFSFGEVEIMFYDIGTFAVSVRIQTPCGNVFSQPFYVTVN